MKTNEEKLKRLLEIAVQNGWNTKINWISEKSKLSYYTQQGGHYTLYSNNGKSYDFRLNDLVTNWEEGEVSFIESLCKADIEKISLFWFEEDLIASVRICWNLKPTSQRLDWLFNTFKHLL